MTMHLLDLFCGQGGWSQGFSRHGWTCTGIDCQDHGYPFGKLILLTLPIHDEAILAFTPDFITASPPCEEYARHHLPWLKGPPPDLTLLTWAVALANRLDVPTLVECSRFAALHVPGSSRVGSYRLWGAIPALLPTVPQRKMKTSGTNPGRRAFIDPILSDWIASTRS